jgi:hypothetical protein
MMLTTVNVVVMGCARGGRDWAMDQRAGYRNGSIVAVYIGQSKPESVTAPKTAVIHMAEVDLADALDLQQSMNAVGTSNKKAWFVQWQRMPLALRNQLADDRLIETDWTTFTGWLRNGEESRDFNPVLDRLRLRA